VVQPGFDGADGHASDLGDLVEGEVVEEPQEQQGALGLGKGGEGGEEPGFLLPLQEVVEWVGQVGIHGSLRGLGSLGRRVDPTRFAAPTAGLLEAALVKDAEDPGAELAVVAQGTEVPDGGNEGLLDGVEGGGVIVQEFAGIDVEPELERTEQSVPGVGIIRSRPGHEGCFIWEHTGTQHRVECPDHPERSRKSCAC